MGEVMQRHTLFQRMSHWLNALAVLTLTYSGWMIYRPRGISSEATPFDSFFWHRWGAALLLMGIAFHVVYESFIARGANPMAVNRAQAKIILAVIKNFFGLGWDSIYYNRLFHGFFSATLGATLIVHFYFALLIKKNWVETKSMITGRVPLREYLDSHSLLD